MGTHPGNILGKRPPQSSEVDACEVND